MTAISQHTSRKIKEVGPRLKYGVKDATTIYQGAYLGVVAAEGYALGYVSTTTDKFIGIALEGADNSGGADAALYVLTSTSGVLEDIAVTGAADGVEELGNAVYVTDSGTMTLTGTNNNLVGNIINYNAVTGRYDVWYESTYAQVYIDTDT